MDLILPAAIRSLFTNLCELACSDHIPRLQHLWLPVGYFDSNSTLETRLSYCNPRFEIISSRFEIISFARYYCTVGYSRRRDGFFQEVSTSNRNDTHCDMITHWSSTQFSDPGDQEKITMGIGCSRCVHCLLSGRSAESGVHTAWHRSIPPSCFVTRSWIQGQYIRIVQQQASLSPHLFAKE